MPNADLMRMQPGHQARPSRTATAVVVELSESQPARGQSIYQVIDDYLLRLAVEIDQHVPNEDAIKRFSRHGLHEIVPLKTDKLLELGANLPNAFFRSAPKETPPSFFADGCHGAFRIDTFPRAAKGRFANVGTQDA